MLNYNHAHARKHVEKMPGMYWDEDFAGQADQTLHAFGVSQDGWDVIVPMYANRVKQLFTPSSYSYWQRIKFACYFLNPFSKG